MLCCIFYVKTRSVIRHAWSSLLAAVELDLPQRSANWVSAALLLASDRIPQLFLLNAQTKKKRRVAGNHNRRKEKERINEGKKRGKRRA